LRKTFLTGTRIVIAIALPLTIGLIVLARPLLHLWVGSGFAAAVPVVVCLAATTTIWALSGPGVYVLRGMGDVRRPALIDSFEAVLNLSLSIALGLSLGLKGVAIATLIAAAVTRLGFMLHYVCRQTSTSFVAFTTQLARTFALPGLATLGVGFALRDSGTGEITEVLTAAAGMTLTYVVVLIAVGLSRSERVALATWVRTRTT
jgi:O-antigen/teichoic acid export membrane protein